jgi:hypothetical protein
MDSDISAYSASELSPSQHSYTPANRPWIAESSQVPSLRVDTLSVGLSSASLKSPSRSPDSYLPTPDESVASTDEEVTQMPPKPLDHVRNASYAGAGRTVNPLRLSLTAKKSLPDLRTVKLHERRPGAPDLSTLPMPTRSFTDDNIAHASSSVPTRWRQNSAGSSASASGDAASSASRAVPKPFADGPISASPTSTHTPGRSVDLERHAYFRRFSTVHQAATGAVVPPALAAVVAGARAVLYALTQLHQTVINHATHMADERLGGVLRKILAPSFRAIERLIGALDRFDALVARRTVPSPAACRAVAEATRECVGVFNAVAKALAVQTRVIGARDDPLYVRGLLLQVWGASAELAGAWAGMAPQLDAAAPFMRERRAPPASRARGAQVSPTKEKDPAVADEPPASAPPGAGAFSPTAATMPRSRSVNAPDKEEKARRARRHAGSFSARDVEIGRYMSPHMDDPPPVPELTSPTSGVPPVSVVSPASSSTPTPRAIPHMESFLPASGGAVLPPRKGSVAGMTGAHEGASRPGTAQSVSVGLGLSRVPREGHSRQGSQASASASSTSSPSLPNKLPQLEIPADASAVVDRDALVAMRRAVDAAPAVWDLMEEIVQDAGGRIPYVDADVAECVARARGVTASFEAHIRAIESADPAADRVALRDDAHVFLKVRLRSLA